jgi:hypothetical protein
VQARVEDRPSAVRIPKKVIDGNALVKKRVVVFIIDIEADYSTVFSRYDDTRPEWLGDPSEGCAPEC